MGLTDDFEAMDPLEREYLNKSCSCGAIFTDVPITARSNNEPDDPLAGWYWECPNCGSTMFKPREP